jgi:chromosome segregation ATPase
VNTTLGISARRVSSTRRALSYCTTFTKSGSNFAMSPTSGSRRGRSEIEDDEDSEPTHNSGNSTPERNSAKRVRTNGPTSNPSTHGQRKTFRDNDGEDDNSEDDGEAVDPEAFQPGAIVRVKVANFVTYEKAEFFPGPNLNMVIGPNGTGKSSLVCAICLGLGFSPRILGRGDSFVEFVKHGCSNAEIEIELYKKPDEPRNRVVRVKLTREGNGKDWWIDGKKSSVNAVQSLVKSCNIQIDNLCQFLPQDKVSHFSRMSAVELLLQTQRAAAPEEMIEQHDKLKKYRGEQKKVEQATEADRERLSGLQSRQENLRAEVQRLEERNQVIEKIDVLRKTIPFVEYTIARKQHLAFKKKKEASQKRFKELELEVKPTLEAAQRKKDYQARIAVAVKARQKAVEQAEGEAQKLATKMESLDDQISTAVNSLDAERAANRAKQQEIKQLQRKIHELKTQQANAEPIEFDSHEWNEKIVSRFNKDL